MEKAIDNIIKKLQNAKSNPELKPDDLTEISAELISLSNRLLKSLV